MQQLLFISVISLYCFFIITLTTFLAEKKYNHWISLLIFDGRNNLEEFGGVISSLGWKSFLELTQNSSPHTFRADMKFNGGHKKAFNSRIMIMAYKMPPPRQTAKASGSGKWGVPFWRNKMNSLCIFFMLMIMMMINIYSSLFTHIGYIWARTLCPDRSIWRH